MIRRTLSSAHSESIETIFEEWDGPMGVQSPLYISNVQPSLFFDIVKWLYRNAPVGLSAGFELPVRVIASESDINKIWDTFRLGHQVLELTQTNQLELRASDQMQDNPIFFSRNSIYTVVDFSRHYEIFEVINREADKVTQNHIKNTWEKASEVESPELPSWGAVMTSLAEATRPETRNIFQELLDYREAAPLEKKLDLVTLLLLAAGRTGMTQLALAEWATDHSLFSKSILSRRKRELVAQDVLGTNKIPKKGRGRNPEALVFKKSYFSDVDNQTMYDRVADVFTVTPTI